MRGVGLNLLISAELYDPATRIGVRRYPQGARNRDTATLLPVADPGSWGLRLEPSCKI